MRLSAFARLLPLFLLQQLPLQTRAEGGCPPGMLPASGTDISSCAPAPPGYYRTQPQPLPPPPPLWASRWGAIATYAPTGVLGSSENLPSKDQAEQAALADCKAKGGLNCKVDIAYGNECAAVVVGDKGYNVNPGATADLASERGIKICAEDGGKGCHVYYSACSLPKRIR